MLAQVLCTVHQPAPCGVNCENSVKHLPQSDLQVRKAKRLFCHKNYQCSALTVTPRETKKNGEDEKQVR